MLFVATGEAHEGAHEGAWPPLDGSPEQTATSGHTQTVEKTVGGSLLLKFAAGLSEHGQACCFVVPVRPHPGELWAFPGFVPHCVLPRRLGKIAAVAEVERFCSLSKPRSRTERDGGGVSAGRDRESEITDCLQC